MKHSDETGTNGRQLLLIAAFVGNERNVISAVGVVQLVERASRYSICLFMSLLHSLHLHFDWNIVCRHTAHIYTDAFDSLHKSVNNFLSEEQRGQMCPILSSVCLCVLVQMLLLFMQSAYLRRQKGSFLSLFPDNVLEKVLMLYSKLSILNALKENLTSCQTIQNRHL